MKMFLLFLLALLPNLAFAADTGAANCTDLNELAGSWTSTNVGTIIFSTTTPHFTMNHALATGETTTTFDCLTTNDTTKYILKSIDTISVFSGTTSVNAYLCFDLRKTNNNTYYYYLQSSTETGFGGFRAIGSTASLTDPASVCTLTLDTAEFHTIIKDGSETDAVSMNNLPDMLLGSFYYVINDTSASTCDSITTATIDSCNTGNLTHIVVDNTGCTTIDPFYSTGGLLGGLGGPIDTTTDTYYTVLYNLDSTTSNKFICMASTSDNNGTVNLTYVSGDCSAGQTASTVPSGGFIMRLEANCVPTNIIENVSTNWIWLILLMIGLGILAIVLIVVICLYLRQKRKVREEERKKGVLNNGDHPLGEMSISLDAPASMDRMSDPLMEMRTETYRSPRKKKGKEMVNPLGETSMHLDFKHGRSWSTYESPTGVSDIDPFTEMDNGVVLPMANGTKAARSMRNSKQKSFVMNGHGPKSNGMLPITDGTTIGSPPSGNRTPRSSRSMKAPSIKAYSAAQSARSIKETPESSRALSVRSESMRAPSVKAESVKAMSVRAPASTKGSIRSRLTRSATSTKIGSVTNRQGSVRKKKTITRSKTMIPVAVDTKTKTGDDGINEFMEGEMMNGGAMSESGRSKKSGLSMKSRVSKLGPKKSILKKNSSFFSSKEFLTEDEIFQQSIRDRERDLDPDKTASGLIHDSLRESYLKDKQARFTNLSSSLKQPHATKGPWK